MHFAQLQLRAVESASLQLTSEAKEKKTDNLVMKITNMHFDGTIFKEKINEHITI